MLMALCFKLYCGFQRAILLSISLLSIIIPVYLFSLSFSPIALAYQKPHTHTHTHTHNHTQTVSKPSLFVAATAHNNRADHVSQSGTTNVRASKVLYLERGLIFMASDVLTMRCIILRTQMRVFFTILNLPLWTQKIVVDRKCRFFCITDCLM